MQHLRQIGTDLRRSHRHPLLQPLENNWAQLRHAASPQRQDHVTFLSFLAGNLRRLGERPNIAHALPVRCLYARGEGLAVDALNGALAGRINIEHRQAVGWRGFRRESLDDLLHAAALMQAHAARLAPVGVRPPAPGDRQCSTISLSAFTYPAARPSTLVFV